jgi:hypothetical protein
MNFAPPPPPTTSQKDIDFAALYEKRFRTSQDRREKIWRVLCKHFFQKFVPEDAVIVDIAAGYCEFINNIKARKKLAFDLRDDLEKCAAQDVKAVNDSFFNMESYLDEKPNIIFASNIFEHLNNKEEVTFSMELCYKNLASKGRLLIVQPNIKYLAGRYWDVIDHKIALTDLSLIEAGQLSGFSLVKNIKRFLPYSPSSKLPQYSFLVYLYLKFPLAWRFLGEHSFIVLEKQ